MRSKMFMVAAFALVAMIVAVAAFADAPTPTPPKKAPVVVAPTASCSATGVSVDVAGYFRVDSAACFTRVKQKNGTFKSVRIRARVLLVGYVSKDADGNQCGALVKKVNIGRFKATPPGLASISADVTLAPQDKRYKQTGKKIVNFSGKKAKVATQAVKAMCGTPASAPKPKLPDAGSCADLPVPSTVAGCGTPTLPDGSKAQQGCQWSVAPSISALHAGLGNVVCPSGSCWPRLGSTKSWLGNPIQVVIGFLCSDQTGFEADIWYVKMTNPAGQLCGPTMPPYSIVDFIIPSNWGGRITVLWQIERGSNNGETLGSALWPVEAILTGTEDGCPQLTASGLPFTG